MKDFVVITGLLVISLASLTCSYPEIHQNGLTNVYDNNIPSIQGGFISQLLKNILGFIQGILVELEQISRDNFMKRFTGNWPSTNDNFNGPNKFDNELNRSQKMTQSPKISGSMTTYRLDNLSDADETNKSQYSDEESAVEPQVKNEINKDNVDMTRKSDLPSTNYNLNKPKQLKYELNRSQKMTQSPKISESMTTYRLENLSDADDTNESQYSEEKSPVEPQIKKIKNEINTNSNVDMTEKFVPAKPRNMPNTIIGGQNSPLASKGEILNMERVKSIGKNTGFEKILNVGNSNVQNKKDVINVNCDTKSFEYGGKTYVDSEYEIEYGGSKKLKTTISGIQLTGLKKARKLSEKESAWVKEKLNSCYNDSEGFYESTSEDYEED